MNLILISDFGFPSGYQAITEGIATRMAEAGNKVLVLGIGYDARAVNYPFGVIPVSLSYVPMTLTGVLEDLEADWLLFVMDAERAIKIGEKLAKEVPDFFSINRSAVLFPVESDPFSRNWSVRLQDLFMCLFTFTDFGIKCLSDADAPATKVGVGISDFWYDDSQIEELSINADFILTVAVNQIRKNLPAGFRVFTRFLKDHPDYRYCLLTQVEHSIGWELTELVNRYDIGDRVVVINPGVVENKQLKSLYRQAKCVLLTTHAEGIGLPIYEAQSQGCPVVATNCTAVTEAVEPDYLVDTDGKPYTFPWGLVNYYNISEDDCLAKLEKAIQNRATFVPKKYPNWQPSADIIIRHLSAFDSVSAQLTSKGVQP